MNAASLDFINSEFRDFRGRWVRDDLQRPEWLEQFLMRWGLQIGDPPDSTTMDELMVLRSLLCHIVEALSRGQISDDDLAALNTILRSAPSIRHLSRDNEINGYRKYQLDLVPLKKDWSWVQAEIVASFADLLIQHDSQRLKICQNSNCRWIFYDESKSRTRRYCTVDKCANLMKVRRFRARRRGEVQKSQKPGE